MNQKTRDLAIFALLILTFLIWSNSFIAIKVLIDRMRPFDLVKLRFIPVGLISLLLILLFYRTQAKAILKEHPWRVIWSGLLSVTIYNLFLNSGMRYVQPNAASLLIALNPLITLLLAVRFLGEPMTKRRLWGTGQSTFAGLAMVVLWGRVGESVRGPDQSRQDSICPHGARRTAELGHLHHHCQAGTEKPLPGRFQFSQPGHRIAAAGSLGRPALRHPGQVTSLARIRSRRLSFSGLHPIGLRFVEHCHPSLAGIQCLAVRLPQSTPDGRLFILVFWHGHHHIFFIGGSVMLSGIVLATLPSKKRRSQLQEAAIPPID